MKFLIILILLSVSSYVSSQKIIVSRDEVKDKVISIMETYNREDIDYNDITERLEGLINNPIDLNTATKQDLTNLFFLNETQIYNFLVYRYTYNHFMSIYELKLIPTFDAETIDKILPFITIRKQINNDSIPIITAITHDILTRYQRNSRLSKANYLGSMDGFYLKYKLNVGKRFILGFVADKDPGEQFFKGYNTQGFDFYSGYFQINGQKVLKKTIIGDFNIEIGQGLTLWSAISFGKSSSGTTLCKSGRGLCAKTSAMEGLFFRGAATQMCFSNLDLILFASYRNIDATVSQYSNINNPLEITTIYNDGYHRTESEMKRKRSTAEFVSGGRLGYNNIKLNIGLTAYYMKLGAKLNPTESQYNRHVLRGKENINIGIDYKYLFMNNAIYGEVAISKNGGVALISGIDIIPHQVISLSISGRYYKDNYQNLFSNAVEQYSNNRNEFGIYTAIEVQILDNLSLISYADIYQTLSASYRSYSAIKEQECLLGVKYNMSTNLIMRLKYVYKNRASNLTTDSTKTIKTQYIPQNKVSFTLNYYVSNKLELENNISFNSNRYTDNTHKIGFFADVSCSYRLIMPNMRLTAAYMIFNTDGYDERIYAYENDLLYSNSFVSHTGKGSRYYLLIACKIIPQLQIWIKWSQAFEDNNQSMLTIRNSEVKIQAQIKL